MEVTMNIGYCWEEEKNQVSCLGLSVLLLCLWMCLVAFCERLFLQFIYLCEQNSKFFHHFTKAQGGVPTQQAKKPNPALAARLHTSETDQKYHAQQIMWSVNWILWGLWASQRQKGLSLMRLLLALSHEREREIHIFPGSLVPHIHHQKPVHLHLKQHANKTFWLYTSSSWLCLKLM